MSLHTKRDEVCDKKEKRWGPLSLVNDNDLTGQYQKSDKNIFT